MNLQPSKLSTLQLPNFLQCIVQPFSLGLIINPSKEIHPWRKISSKSVKINTSRHDNGERMQIVLFYWRRSLASDFFVSRLSSRSWRANFSSIFSILLLIFPSHIFSSLTTCPFLFQVRLQSGEQWEPGGKRLRELFWDFWAALPLWQIGQDARHDRRRCFLHGGGKKKGTASQFPPSSKIKI